MVSIRTILVPILFKDHPPHVMQQAAWLARRFNAQVILLHVVAPFDYPAGILEGGHEITARDLHARIIQQAQLDLDRPLQPEFDGIAVTRLLLRGDPAREIVTAARARNADIIVMPTHGHGALYRFLLGSVTAKVLHESPCGVWTGAHLEEGPERPFSIRHVLCSVDLTPHCHYTAKFAAELATAVDATLTLVHITPSVEMYGPGGSHTDVAWKEAVVGAATKDMANLQHDLDVKADSRIDSGNVVELLNRAAEQMKADVLVIGHSLGRSHLGDNSNGYGIIRESRVPVLSI